MEQQSHAVNTLYKSRPMLIGKHEWRVIVTPFHLGGNCLEYQWRPASRSGLPESMRTHWRGVPVDTSTCAT